MVWYHQISYISITLIDYIFLSCSIICKLGFLLVDVKWSSWQRGCQTFHHPDVIMNWHDDSSSFFGPIDNDNSHEMMMIKLHLLCSLLNMCVFNRHRWFAFHINVYKLILLIMKVVSCVSFINFLPLLTFFYNFFLFKLLFYCCLHERTPKMRQMVSYYRLDCRNPLTHSFSLLKTEPLVPQLTVCCHLTPDSMTQYFKKRSHSFVVGSYQQSLKIALTLCVDCKSTAFQVFVS